VIVSLRLRLAIWHAALTGAVVASVCLYSYAIYARARYDFVDSILHHSALHVAGELAAGVPPERIATILAAQALDTRMQLYREDGTLLIRGSLDAPPVSLSNLATQGDVPYGLVLRLAPSMPHDPPVAGHYGTVSNDDGERWRVFALPSGSAGVLVATLSLRAIDGAVHVYAKLMLIMGLVGSGASFIVALLLASRALRPITALRETASLIARSREFSKRVPQVTSRDELGSLAVTFNEMLVSLEQAYATQQRFVSDASHELRAPLTVIQANLELLKRHEGMPQADRRRALDEAHAETMRLGRLAADLLVLARADAGMPLRQERVEVDRVLLEVLGEMRHLTRGQRLEIVALTPALVLGDPDRIKQLLVIVLDNAIRYTPPTGRIGVSLARIDDEAVLTFEDTGIGISAEDLPKVFERFYRADRARARDAGGAGLGLAIARWVADQHEAELTLTSELGRGTIVSVRFPLAP
jgi:two-component system OmpR family sensor kinase